MYLTKEVKDLYHKNYTPLKKEIERHQKIERSPILHRMAELIS
jgi:hypothetical protein